MVQKGPKFSGAKRRISEFCLARARSGEPCQKPAGDAHAGPQATAARSRERGCLWRSRSWLRSRLASWAAVAGLGTACAWAEARDFDAPCLSQSGGGRL